MFTAKVRNNHNFECDNNLCFTLIFMKEGYHTRKYKRYLDDPSVPVPKSTELEHNRRSATRSNTASHLDSSVCLSIELAVVPTESSASHNGETFTREIEQLYAITEVHRNSRLQMVMYSPKRSRAWKGV